MNRVVSGEMTPYLEHTVDELLRGDPTRFYRQEIEKVRMLTSEEVTHLAQCIEQEHSSKRRTSRTTRESYGTRRMYATNNTEDRPVQDSSILVQDSREARKRLIEANLRLVMHLARRYRGFGVDVIDLVQEGNLGLIHAVEKYDHRKGCRFSTYATWWIRQYITRALASQAHAIRLPIYKLDELRRLGRVQQDLQQSLDGEPTPEMLASQMSMDVQEIQALLSTIYEQETISLDMPRRNGEEDPEAFLSDTIEDDARYAPEQIVLTQTLREQIQEMLSLLSQRERRVLQLRYGLDGQKEHSLTEAGKKLGLSHEAIRQVEFRALRKLELPSRSRMLHDYLE